MSAPRATANSVIEEKRRFFFGWRAFRIAASTDWGTVTPCVDSRAGRFRTSLPASSAPLSTGASPDNI